MLKRYRQVHYFICEDSKTTTNPYSKMRTLVFILLGLVAVYAAPAAEDINEAAFMAELDSDSHLSPMEDEEVTLAKRMLSDEDLENLLLAKMELAFKILGPLAPQQVKDVIRQIVNERKYEIVQALKQGGGMLFKILIEIWRKAFLGGLLG